MTGVPCAFSLIAGPDASAEKGDTGVHKLFAESKILGDEAGRRAFDWGDTFDRGESDAEGNPAREPVALAVSGLTLSMTCLIMAVAILAASPLIMRSLMPQMEINANSGDGGDRVLSRVGANEEHASPAQLEHPDPGVQSEPRLIVQQRVSCTDSIPLGIQVGGETGGVALEISDLPSGSTISKGWPLGAGRWRILATDANNAMVHPPAGFSGTIDLAIDLRLIDNTVVEHKSLHLEWLPRPIKPDPTESARAMADSESSAEKALATAVPTDRNAIHHAAKSQLDHERIELLIERSQQLISEGDVEAARILLQRAAEAGDARATLTLGGTYDPVVLAMLQVHGVAADVSTARDWYKKASEFGSREAQQRLNLLTAALTPIGSAGGTFVSDNDPHKVVPTPMAKPKRRVVRPST
jgi:hypothetical protein